MKNATIIAVRPILGIEKPIIVLETTSETLVRNPKQMFTDLQNSGRFLNAKANVFARGIENVSDALRAQFIDECHKLVGAQVSGDWKAFKAGDFYTIESGHPALTDVNHPLYNKVKEGDKQKAEADGVWITGFLSIPKTAQERMQETIADRTAGLLAGMFGFTSNTAVAQVASNPLGLEEEDLSLAEVVSSEAVSKEVVASK